MLYKNLCIISFGLIKSALSASSTVNPETSETMLKDKGMALLAKRLDELMTYNRKIIDEFYKVEKVYKIIAEKIIEKYNISFSRQNKTYVFKARIPKIFEQRDIYEITENVLAEHVPTSSSDKTCASHTTKKNTIAQAETCISVLNALIGFANEKLGMQNPENLDKDISACKIVYVPEKAYDANVILAINYFIELIGNEYICTYLYNYEIDIKAEEEYFIYNVIFFHVPNLTRFNVPKYHLTPEFQEYCEELSQLDLKELSERETANKFLEWANANKKTELSECISENKKFFEDVFDVIRKRRSTRLDIYYYDNLGFCASRYRRPVNPFFETTFEEDDVMWDLEISMSESAILRPFAAVEVTNYGDELTKDITYKDAFERDFMVTTFATKLASVYYLVKLNKYTSDDCEEDAESYSEKDETSSFFEFLPDTSLVDLDEMSTEALKSNIEKVNEIFDILVFLLVDITNLALKHKHIDTKVEYESLPRYDKKKVLEKMMWQNCCDLDELRFPFDKIICDSEIGIPGLIKLEKELDTKKLKWKDIIKRGQTSSESDNEPEILKKEIKELEKKIIKRKDYLHSARHEIFLATKSYWDNLSEFLERIKNY